ncbi:MAG: hypothetical protein Q8L98_01120 [Chlamydiales bacterium]|nr:hypothetical protein [Chlamydiales bacterium]
MNSINIFQKNWAFTSSDSKKPQIKTGSFGPCYVVTFASSKFAAVAHIDDTTNVDSIACIFHKFIEHSIPLKDVKVIVLGGWKRHPESFKWGIKIQEKIKEFGCKEVSTKNMYSKETPTIFQQMGEILMSEVSRYYHLGVLVDSSNGKTFLLNEISPSLEEEQLKQTQEFAKKYSSDSSLEVPLTQVNNL